LVIQLKTPFNLTTNM